MDFSVISRERALEFRDHVVAREPFFLRDLAGWVADTGGPLEVLDASAESLVDLWAWAIGFIDAGCPGVPADARSSRAAAAVTDEDLRPGAVADRLVHYVRLVVERHDPPARWALLTSGSRRWRDAYEQETVIKRSDGTTPYLAFMAIICHGLLTGRARTREPDRLLQLVQAGFPSVVTGAARGGSVLAPYLTADLGEVPEAVAVSPVLRWAAEDAVSVFEGREVSAGPEPAAGLVKCPQLVVMRGPGAGLEDPSLLRPLDEGLVAAALGELGFMIEGRVPVAADLSVDEATFVVDVPDVWTAEVSVAAHGGRLRLVDLDQAVATPEQWDVVVKRLRRLARRLWARLGEPDELDTDD